MVRKFGTIRHVNTIGSTSAALALCTALLLAAKSAQRKAQPKAERQKTERELWNEAVEAKKKLKKGQP